MSRPPAGRMRLGDRGARSRSRDRKSTRLNSSHQINSYAVFCLNKTIFKQTKPPKRFIQSYFLFEQRRVSESIGLLRRERYDKNKLSLSGSPSTNFPQ